MGTIAKVTAGGATHLVASTCYGTCDTAKDVVAKVATIQDSQAFTLMTGVTVHIKFTYHNTADAPTLNVNSTGAKAIKRYGTSKTGTSETESWYAGSVVSFTYDGTNWIQNDYKYDTTYSSKAAASGGTDVSLCTTGEKYTWNNKSEVKSVLLTSSMSCTYADSSTIGYRTTNNDRVQVSSMTGYPTGKTILGYIFEYAYVGSAGEYYKMALVNLCDGYVSANSKISGTVRFGLRVIYID